MSLRRRRHLRRLCQRGRRGEGKGGASKGGREGGRKGQTRGLGHWRSNHLSIDRQAKPPGHGARQEPRRDDSSAECDSPCASLLAGFVETPLSCDPAPGPPSDHRPLRPELPHIKPPPPDWRSRRASRLPALHTPTHSPHPPPRPIERRALPLLSHQGHARLPPPESAAASLRPGRARTLTPLSPPRPKRDSRQTPAGGGGEEDPTRPGARPPARDRTTPAPPHPPPEGAHLSPAPSLPRTSDSRRRKNPRPTGLPGMTRHYGEGNRQGGTWGGSGAQRRRNRYSSTIPFGRQPRPTLRAADLDGAGYRGTPPSPWAADPRHLHSPE